MAMKAVSANVESFPEVARRNSFQTHFELPVIVGLFKPPSNVRVPEVDCGRARS